MQTTRRAFCRDAAWVLAGGIFVPTIAKAQRALPWLPAQKKGSGSGGAGGGGSPAWYDSILLASATTYVNYNGDGASNACWAAKVTLPTGNVTKLRVGNLWAYTTGTVKLALYDSAKDLVVGVTGVSIPATHSTTTEASVASTAVTAGTFWVAAAASTNQINLGELAGQAAASCVLTYTDTYAGMNVSSISGWSEFTSKLALGAYV